MCLSLINRATPKELDFNITPPPHTPNITVYKFYR